jgi:zinc protease
MKIFHNIYLAILFATVSLSHTSFHSQVDRTQAPEPGPAPLIELGESTLLTLDNGLILIVVENHKQPKISWNLSFEYAPIFEGKKAGILDLFG